MQSYNQNHNHGEESFEGKGRSSLHYLHFNFLLYHDANGYGSYCNSEINDYYTYIYTRCIYTSPP